MSFGLVILVKAFRVALAAALHQHWALVWDVGLTQNRSLPQAAHPQSVFPLNTRNPGWNDVLSAAF